MLILEPSEANPSSQRIMTSSEETTLGKLPHSHSSPANVDSAGSMTPDREVKKPGKLLSVTVRTMDDSEIVFHIQHKALGQVLFDQVCKQLHLLEVDYFGLEYTDSNGVKYWLDHEKPMNRQIGLTLVKPELRFCVKFFTPDPAQLEEEYTRYLFCLQIKRDLTLGILQCNDNTAAIMASYIVQAECGDYVAEDYPDHTYLSSYKFFPHQDEELERRIMENHKKHVGQTPAEADLNLLETARRCELYGIKMHPAKDHEGVPLNLAVAHMGVLVFQNYTKINTFSWAKIRKLSFKRKRFLLKLHPEGYAPSNNESGTSSQGYYKDTVEFYFDGRNECKNFWKKCVEHHGFFRCATVKKLPRQKTRVLSRGSSFRYSGRTQKQIVDYVRDNYVKRQPFQRSQSFRHSCSAHSGVGGSVGPSISAQPLLPVGDTLTGTPVSHSCGSVALSDDSSPSPVHTSILDPSPMVAVPSSNSSMKPIANGTVHEGPVHRKPLDIVDDDTTHIQEERIHSHTGSHSTLPQGSSRLNQEAPEPNANDNDDNVSHASYQLEDPNMQSQETKGARVGGFKGPELNKAQTHMGDKGRKENVEGQTEQTDEGEGQGEKNQKINGEIPYTLHRRHVDNENVGNNKQNIGEAKQSDDKKDIQIGKNLGTPAKPSRVTVEVEHPKISHSSPTLYARSRLNSPARPSKPPATPSRISDTPPSPATKVVDFVSVHDLPASRSYSSQDDSVNRGSLEEEIFEQLRKRQINEEKNTFLQNAINDSLTQKESLAAAKKAFINAELEQKTEDNFAPHNLCNGESFIVNIAELPKPSSVLEEKQNQALKQGILRQFSNSSTDSSSDSADNTILMGENLNLNTLRIVEEGDLDPTVQMAVLPCKQKATLTVLPPSPDFRLKFKQVEEASTAFGQDRGLDNLIGENQDDPSDVELLPPDGDLDEDEGLERMFPMRTLSRISERSTSDSKASSPSDPSSKRSDPPGNGGDLPSDYSTSEDNPPHSNETDSSEQIHQYSGGDVQVYENQYVLPDEDTDTTNPVETRYYLEINSEQEEQLEQLQRRGRYYQQNFDMDENFDDTSSADNDTLCEDMSFPEGMEILEDIEEQTEAFSSETEQDQYEGINIRIHVSPNKSPSPIRTPESYSLDKSAGSGSSKKRHRTVLELHVSNGHILENKHASMNSPNIEHMSNTIVNPYAEELYHDTTKP